ncbi:hypothetical protein ACH5RR_037260 [Cinchona calisaya]|uniref:Uncharacterized protein n=1 Tax=Cinchona calisaya TaxID=153742 RepID=A0ABD2Y7W5_9GENT
MLAIVDGSLLCPGLFSNRGKGRGYGHSGWGHENSFGHPINNQFVHNALQCENRFNHVYTAPNLHHSLATTHLDPVSSTTWFPDTGASTHMTVHFSWILYEGFEDKEDSPLVQTSTLPTIPLQSKTQHLAAPVDAMDGNFGITVAEKFAVDSNFDRRAVVDDSAAWDVSVHAPIALDAWSVLMLLELLLRTLTLLKDPLST